MLDYIMRMRSRRIDRRDVGYNRLVNPPPAGEQADLLHLPLLGRGLAGLMVSGILFGFLGAILPAWGYHLSSDYSTVGDYFLGMAAGIIISTKLAGRLLARRGVGFLLISACILACLALIYLALLPPPVHPLQRTCGLVVLGLAAGFLNTAVFYTISPAYERDRAATVNFGGLAFSLGCVAISALVAGTFYASSVQSILFIIAAIPALFAVWYARTPIAQPKLPPEPTLGRVFHDFRSTGAILLAALLFFQFANEWSIAGWLPIFLIHRLGISPKTSLLILTMYWLALLLGRLAAVGLLPRMRHGRLLAISAVLALFGCVLLLETNNVFGASMGTLFVGCGFASIYPLVAERIGSEFPDYRPGFFNGIFSVALAGGMLAPGTLGYLADNWGVGIVMLIPVLGTCMVFVLVLLIWLEAKLRLG